MTLADGIAIGVGNAVKMKLPERTIRYGAAAVFLLSGVLTLALALRG